MRESRVGSCGQPRAFHRTLHHNGDADRYAFPLRAGRVEEYPNGWFTATAMREPHASVGRRRALPLARTPNGDSPCVVVAKQARIVDAKAARGGLRSNGISVTVRAMRKLGWFTPSEALWIGTRLIGGKRRPFSVPEASDRREALDRAWDRAFPGSEPVAGLLRVSFAQLTLST